MLVYIKGGLCTYDLKMGKVAYIIQVAQGKLQSS